MINDIFRIQTKFVSFLEKKGLLLSVLIVRDAYTTNTAVRNYWVFGLILYSKEHNVSEAGSPSGHR
jgi:hypothetical protein